MRAPPRPALLALLLAALLPRGARALYFFVSDQARCFIEEVPAETLVVATYKNPDVVTFGTPGAEFTGIVSAGCCGNCGL